MTSSDPLGSEVRQYPKTLDFAERKDPQSEDRCTLDRALRREPAPVPASP